jgi:hypothetical protein
LAIGTMADRSQIRFICDSVTYGSAKTPTLMLVGHFSATSY